MIRVLILAALLTLVSCGWMKQTTEIGDGSEATVNQQQDSAQGAKVQAEKIGDVTTKNVDGIPVWWFMVGSLVFGAIIPQPRLLKLIW